MQDENQEQLDYSSSSGTNVQSKRKAKQDLKENNKLSPVQDNVEDKPGGVQQPKLDAYSKILPSQFDDLEMMMTGQVKQVVQNVNNI